MAACVSSIFTLHGTANSMQEVVGFNTMSRIGYSLLDTLLRANCTPMCRRMSRRQMPTMHTAPPGCRPAICDRTACISKLAAGHAVTYNMHRVATGGMLVYLHTQWRLAAVWQAPAGRPAQ